MQTISKSSSNILIIPCIKVMNETQSKRMKKASGCHAIFDMVVWNGMTDGTSENRMNENAIVL